MKNHPYLIIIIIICSTCQAQGIKELYSDKFKSDWTVYENEDFVKRYIDTTVVYKLASGRTPEEELLFQAKENHIKRAERIGHIFSSLKVNIKELNSCVFIEQRSLKTQPPFDFTYKGAIIAKDSVHGFSYDTSMDNIEIIPYDYFQNSDNQMEGQAKQVIQGLILNKKTNYLDSIAKVESKMLAGPLQNLRPDTEFEIMIYDKNQENELRRVYIHETFIRIMNQK